MSNDLQTKVKINQAKFDNPNSSLRYHFSFDNITFVFCVAKAYNKLVLYACIYRFEIWRKKSYCYLLYNL